MQLLSSICMKVACQWCRLQRMITLRLCCSISPHADIYITHSPGPRGRLFIGCRCQPVDKQLWITAAPGGRCKRFITMCVPSRYILGSSYNIHRMSHSQLCETVTHTGEATWMSPRFADFRIVRNMATRVPDSIKTGSDTRSEHSV